MHAERCFALGLLLALPLSLSACVSQGKFDDVALERDRLQQRVESLARERDALAGQLETTEMEVVRTEASAAALIRELEAELAAGEIEVRQLVDGIRVEVSDALLFGSGSARLSARGRDVLSRVAGQLKDDTSAISVEGHTDSWVIPADSGSPYESNWELGAARAAQVVKRLSAGGIDPKRLRVVSYGPFDPIASNETPEGRAKNRRTEIVVRRVQP